jgi:hypothetical protein
MGYFSKGDQVDEGKRIEGELACSNRTSQKRVNLKSTTR